MCYNFIIHENHDKKLTRREFLGGLAALGGSGAALITEYRNPGTIKDALVNTYEAMQPIDHHKNIMLWNEWVKSQGESESMDLVDVDLYSEVITYVNQSGQIWNSGQAVLDRELNQISEYDFFSKPDQSDSDTFVERNIGPEYNQLLNVARVYFRGVIESLSINERGNDDFSGSQSVADFTTRDKGNLHVISYVDITSYPSSEDRNFYDFSIRKDPRLMELFTEMRGETFQYIIDALYDKTTWEDFLVSGSRTASTKNVLRRELLGTIELRFGREYVQGVEKY